MKQKKSYYSSRSFKSLALAAGVILAAGLQPTGATLINVDFQVTGGTNFVGLGAIRPAGSGTIWNAFDIPVDGGANVPNGQSLSNLVDEFGGATTVDVAFGTGWSGTFNDAGPNQLQEDRAYTVNTGVGTFTISGLAAGSYNLALISGVTPATATTFVLGGVTKTASAGSANTGFVEGVTHVTFYNVTPTAGEITFTARSTSAGGQQFGVLAGLQVQAIPEPSTLALLGAGGIMLLTVRRRSRRT